MSNLTKLKTLVIIFEYLLVICHCAPSMVNDEESIDTKYIDMNNISDTLAKHFSGIKINVTELWIQQQQMKANPNGTNAAGAPAPFTQRSNEDQTRNESVHRREYEEMALTKIKDQLRSIRNESAMQRASTHEMSFAPACDIPKSRNETLWFESNTLNLFFQPPVKPSLNIGSAILRLYKRNPDNQQRSGEVDQNCADVDSLLRVSVYVYARKSKRAELKKKLCSSTTVARNYQGWIEMDVKLAVKIWERPIRNLGLAIEVISVQELEDVPLKSSDYFVPHSCEASTSNIPWNFYRDELHWTSSEMVRLPHQPRIDILWFNPYPYPHHFQYRHRRRRHNQQKLLKSFERSSSSLSSSSSIETSVEHPSQHQKYHRKMVTHSQSKLQQQQHQHHHHRSSERNRVPNRSIELKSV